MKRLEDIPKQEFYEVPEDYFDKLPGRIQKKIAAGKTSETPRFVYALRYAIPAVVLAAIGIAWYAQVFSPNDGTYGLAAVATEDLVAYLGESDLSTDELVEMVEWQDDDVRELEGEVYQLDVSDEDLENIMNEIDINSL